MGCATSGARAAGAAVAGVAALSVLLVLLVGWASSVGPGEVLTGDGPARITDRATPTPSPSLLPPGAQEDLADRLQDQAPDLGWLRWVALVLEVAMGAGLAYLLWRGGHWAWQTWQARRRPDPAAPDVEFDVLGSPEVLARELVASASEQRRVLAAAGSPRNAVVEAWHRFESGAGRVGATRRPWETSSEFTLRVLEAVDADSRAVARLAQLYREARFSEHELTEDDRAAALEALDAIHRSLRPGVGSSA